MNRVRRRRYLGAVAASTVATTGCLGDVLPRRIGPAPDRLPDLLVVAEGNSDGGNEYTGERLARLSYDAAEESYRPVASYDEATVAEVATHEEGHVLVDASESTRRLVAVDGSLDPTARTTVEGEPSIAVDGEHVYSAASHGFTAFDRSLSPVGRADLPDAFGNKHMEAVALRNGSAYVVDDVVKPVYLFRVDVSDRTAPAYRVVVDASGPHATLDQQWFAPEENRWLCLKVTGTKDGLRQHVLSTPMTGATTELSDYRFDRRPDDAVDSSKVYRWRYESKQRTGTYVDDVSGDAPTYATVLADGRYRIASLAVDDGGDVSIETLAPIAAANLGRNVAAPYGTKTRVIRSGRHVVAAVSGGDAATVYAYDTERGQLVLESEVAVADLVALQVVDG